MGIAAFHFQTPLASLLPILKLFTSQVCPQLKVFAPSQSMLAAQRSNS